ncbi:hypothetical protein DFQ28_010256 [Apophysomyces sp. BC1034]|nr:hypothetical protein DFQ28_010256 [Apophysomyces sp. BC1034]
MPKGKRWLVRKSAIAAAKVFCEIVVPVILYYVLGIFISPVLAAIAVGLLVSGVVIIKRCFTREVDVVGVLWLSSFFLCAIMNFVCSGSTTITFRNATLHLSIGLHMLFSLLPFRWKHEYTLRPFFFYVMKKLTPIEQVRDLWNVLWKQWPYLRNTFRVQTGVCGVALASKFLVLWVLIFEMDNKDDAVYYADMYQIGSTACVVVTFIISGILLKRRFKNLWKDIKVDFRGIGHDILREVTPHL